MSQRFVMTRKLNKLNWLSKQGLPVRLESISALFYIIGEELKLSLTSEAGTATTRSKTSSVRHVYRDDKGRLGRVYHVFLHDGRGG